MRWHKFFVVTVCCIILLTSRVAAQDAALRDEAARALKKATNFFRTQIATEGGYLWRYSDDLARREGEAKATATMVWVQPPGTPSVGFAYLAAYEATSDASYLEAARDVAYALVKGQLRSGGWDYRIEFDPQLRPKYAYRADGSATGQNVTTLDDDNTQAALRLLMRVDQVLQFKDARVHDAAQYALTNLLKAQYPNGAWPQRFSQSPDPTKFPIKKAGYPPSWSRTFPGTDYRGFYTLNDSTLSDMIDTMLEASRVYKNNEYRSAAEKGGGFFLLAQMPEPQPAWAQQYNADMHPVWARKFEPPSVTGGESHRAMRSLLLLYRETGDKKYLEPLPSAIAYFRRSKLPDGRMARFYELETNKPLYFTKDYQLTYSDADMPTHYAFKVANRIEEIAHDLERAQKEKPGESRRQNTRPQKTRTGEALTAGVKAAIAALDDRGRWVDNGRLRYHGEDDPTRKVISTQTFIRNVETLSAYLAATKP